MHGKLISIQGNALYVELPIHYYGIVADIIPSVDPTAHAGVGMFIHQ